MERSSLSASHPRSHLFMVRVWIEELGDGAREVRMQVRHVLSGETRHFRAWPEIAAYMQAKMAALNAEGT
jgi:hypothetical protein